MAKTLNQHKLLQTDFTDRFLGFTERYDEILDASVTSLAEYWVENRNWNYIRYFLSNAPVEYSIPFTIRSFISMSTCEMEYWQDHVTDISALLDEKLALYNEMISFYEEVY